MKRIIAGILTVGTLLLLPSCGSTSQTISDTEPVPAVSIDQELSESSKKKIPDVIGADEADAKNALSAMGFIPFVENDYDNIYEKGKVCHVSPSVGNLCEIGTKVTLTISKGPSFIPSKDSTLTWYNIGTEKDNWEFESPYIKEDTLYIYCKNVKFSKAMEWYDRYNDGHGIGDGSITDSFDKTVPVKVLYKKRKCDANEPQNFTITVPMNELNVSYPTDIYLRLTALDSNNEQFTIRVNFYMTW